MEIDRFPGSRHAASEDSKASFPRPIHSGIVHTGPHPSVSVVVPSTPSYPLSTGVTEEEGFAGEYTHAERHKAHANVPEYHTEGNVHGHDPPNDNSLVVAMAMGAMVALSAAFHSRWPPSA